MPRRVVATFAVAVIAVACGSGHNASGDGFLANPVKVVQQTGASPPPGASVGTTDLYGDRLGTGKFTDGTEVTVYVARSDADFRRGLDSVGTSDDAHTIMVNRDRRILIEVTGVYDLNTGGVDFAVDPEVIARRLHAQIL